MTLLPITGNLRDRFVEVSVLLSLLSPVRGKPTTNNLTQDLPNSDGNSRESLLKRRFLDSFALICATKKDGSSVSAVCLEEDLPRGTVVRVASNAGVSDSVLLQLQEIMYVLNQIGSSGKPFMRSRDTVSLQG